jgi:hypothetical protein
MSGRGDQLPETHGVPCGLVPHRKCLPPPQGSLGASIFCQHLNPYLPSQNEGCMSDRLELPVAMVFTLEGTVKESHD